MSKKFLAGVFAVAAFAFAITASAAYDFGATTLKVGSRGEAVKNVQIVVGATPVDGIFGAMTKAKVMAWQAANGLAADGLFGAMSKAKANAVVGTTPATPTTPTTPTTTLKGDEAELDWSVNVEDDIDQDGKDQHAFTIEIEADEDGGDAKIERLDLVLDVSPSSVATYRSISRVVLEVDGDVIAEADTDSRSDWRRSNDTIRFSNLDLVVKSGDVVEVEVLLDTKGDDLTSVELDEIGYRYVDAAGVVVTDEKSSIGADVAVNAPDSMTFRITENRSNPSDTSLDVSSSKSGVTLALVDVEVREGEGTLEEVEVEITFTGTVTDDTIEDLLSRVTLEVDGDVVDYISSSSFPNEVSDKITLTFDAEEFDMAEDDKFAVEVLANFRANEDGDIETVQVTNVELIGYDEGADESFDGDDIGSASKLTSSFAPIYTLTQGDIDVVISDVDVQETDDRKGNLVFEIEVTNESGSTLSALYTDTSWVFDITKYGGLGTVVIKDLDGSANENTDILDGGVAEYEITIPYTSIGSASFTIEVEKIGGKTVGYTWK